MMMYAAPSTYDGVTESLTIVVLLSEFAMLRAPFLRSQVRLYAFQSLIVTALAIFVAASRHIDALYALAALSLLLKVIFVPTVTLRLLRDADSDLVGSSTIGVATAVLIAIVVSAFGFFILGSLDVRSTSLPTSTLATSVAIVLVAFVLVILRSDVVSQAIGFFSLENGVSIASLVVASRLPLVVAVAFLFDLLVAVVIFGVIMRVHHARADTLSTDVLDRLRG
jgi:hydrogenase-4 component E